MPEIIGSTARARACEDAVMGLPGVRHARASDRTGSLLVLFAPTRVEVDQIRERCARCAATGWPCSRHGAGHANQDCGGAARAIGLAIEILPHVLPLVLKSRWIRC